MVVVHTERQPLDPPTERLPRVQPGWIAPPPPGPMPQQRRAPVPLAPPMPASRARKAVPWVVGGLAALVVISGAVGRGGDEPPTVTEVPVAVADAPLLTPEQTFVWVVEGHGVEVSNRASLVAGGRGVCTAVAAGLTPQRVALQVAAETSLGLADSGYVVGAAVSALCPEYRDLVGG